MNQNKMDYTKSKDAYEGNRESSVYRDSPFPPANHSNRNAYDDGNIPDTDLPNGEGNAVSVEPLPESTRPRRSGPGGE